MLDCVIRSGTVIDGTGSAGRVADIGIQASRIVAIGNVPESGRTEIDATDRVVAPGFIDVHTHYDAQFSWDAAATPSPFHGVTTVIGGNCGFTIAPLAPGQADYLMRMLARVEGMPVAALESGVSWDWRSFGEWLDHLDGNLCINAGFMVGHSAIRRVVMGDATDSAASSDQIADMVQILADSLAGGGLGFSSSRAGSHVDGSGRPVPSRAATTQEFLALSAVVGELPGTQLELIPSNDLFSEDDMNLMAAMSRTANRPLNWNILRVEKADERGIEHQLSASDWAADRGGRVVALTYPSLTDLQISMVTGPRFSIFPEWAPVMTLPIPDRIRAVREPAVRERLLAAIRSLKPGSRLAHLGDFDRLIVAEVGHTSLSKYVGLTVGQIASDRQVDAVEALLDLGADDEFQISFTESQEFDDAESWRRRVALWQDPRCLVGASDAGAHVDQMCGATYTTELIGPSVRDRSLISLEKAVELLTSKPAALFGLRDRGLLRRGFHADIVIFDPNTVGPAPLGMRTDLPGGASRLYAESFGVDHVIVNGTEVIRKGKLLNVTPGTVLRSDRDTSTVFVH
jgi:N-acyl-D-aspartate/D-glutamate deacylase